MKDFTKKDWLLLSLSVIIAISAMMYNQYLHTDPRYFPKSLTVDEIKTLSNDKQSVVIYPILTQKAYEKNGFYDYYSGKCLSCTVVSIANKKINGTYNMGKSGLDYLSKLNYPIITDIDVDKDPKILSKYDVIILLHNEYVTKKEFDAIIKHNNVIYLYPNSLYAQVSLDYDKNLMTLVKGHGYPDKSTGNGFGYLTSSKNEYNTLCTNYKWDQMPNGMQPTCYPEYIITYDRSILQTIKDFPVKIPDLIPINSTYVDVSNIKYCDRSGCNQFWDDVLNKSK